MSDLGNLCGVGFESRKALLKRKVYGIEPELKGKAKIFADFGRNMEKVAILWFENKTGHCCTKLPMVCHRDNQNIAGTIDGMLEDNSILEVKWRCYPWITNAKPFADITEIPLKHYLQLQGYLDLFEKRIGYLLCCSLKNGITMIKIERDQALWRRFILPRIEDFLLKWRQCEKAKNKDEIISQYRMLPNEKKINKQDIWYSMMSNVKNISFFNADFSEHYQKQ